EGRGDEGEDPEDDLSPRAVALRALKEIEFDRATGKLSDADYDVLKTRYTSEALAALRAETGERGAGSGSFRERPAPRARLLRSVRHGARVRRALLPLLRSARRRLTSPPAPRLYRSECGIRRSRLRQETRIHAAERPVYPGRRSDRARGRRLRRGHGARVRTG